MAGRRVLIVDDEEGFRDGVADLLGMEGYDVSVARDAVEAVRVLPVFRPEVILLDLRMPDLDGLAVQKELNRRGSRVSIIVVTAHAEVPIAVKAMQAGAVDFIEKPFSNDVLIASVHRALARTEKSDQGMTKSDDIRRRLELLTAREHEVFDRMMQGWPNKVIAHDLKISQRTVEMHRARVMDKMQAQNLATLIRMTIDVGIPLVAQG